MDIKPREWFVTRIVTVPDQTVPSHKGIANGNRLAKGHGQRPCSLTIAHNPCIILKNISMSARFWHPGMVMNIGRINDQEGVHMPVFYDEATGTYRKYIKTPKDIANEKAFKRLLKFKYTVRGINEKFCSLKIIYEETNTQKPARTIARPFSKKDLSYINKKIKIANSEMGDIISIERQYKKEDPIQFSTQIIIQECTQCWGRCAAAREFIDMYNEIVTGQYGSHAAISAEFMYPYDAAHEEDIVNEA